MQVGARCTVGSMSAAFVLTHAAVSTMKARAGVRLMEPLGGSRVEPRQAVRRVVKRVYRRFRAESVIRRGHCGPQERTDLTATERATVVSDRDVRSQFTTLGLQYSPFVEQAVPITPLQVSQGVLNCRLASTLLTSFARSVAVKPCSSSEAWKSRVAPLARCKSAVAARSSAPCRGAFPPTAPASPASGRSRTAP